MPFTFSHPAIILPLLTLPRKWISATGLVIGSMVPDFEYFIRMKVQSSYSHTLAGLFYFDLPLGLLLAFVFHSQVRNPLIRNLPLCLKSRVFTLTFFNWKTHFARNPVAVLISLLIGCGLSSILEWLHTCRRVFCSAFAIAAPEA